MGDIFHLVLQCSCQKEFLFLPNPPGSNVKKKKSEPCSWHLWNIFNYCIVIFRRKGGGSYCKNWFSANIPFDESKLVEWIQMGFRANCKPHHWGETPLVTTALAHLMSSNHGWNIGCLPSTTHPHRTKNRFPVWEVASHKVQREASKHMIALMSCIFSE